jgi:hypothetical protein
MFQLTGPRSFLGAQRENFRAVALGQPGELVDGFVADV